MIDANDEQEQLHVDDEEFNGRVGGGDSGGGAYPNPHSGKTADNGGFFGHGGQSDMTYHGKGQLGEQELEGNENAPAKSGSTTKN